MRDFVAKGEETGLCQRVTAEVDWNLELSHIAKLNEEASGPALLFEKVKDYDTPVITSVCTTTTRLALIMGLPLESSLVDLYEEWAKLGENLTPPKQVEPQPHPVKKTFGRVTMSISSSSRSPSGIPWMADVLSAPPILSSAKIPRPAGSTWEPTAASYLGKTRLVPSSLKVNTPTSC